MIQFRCPVCTIELKAAFSKKSQSNTCPHCDAELNVPCERDLSTILGSMGLGENGIELDALTPMERPGPSYDVS